MAVTNPKGYNQHNPDPRQTLFLSYYLDPKSDTFSNAMQSALKAGYEQGYAENITGLMPNWLSESIGDNYLIKLAEKNLKEFLEMDVKSKVVRGEIEVEVTDPQLAKIKQDTTKFVSERLNKGKYSTRQELTGKDGEAIKHEVDITEQLKKVYGNDPA